MEQTGRKGKDDVKVSIALVVWMFVLGVLNNFRHHLPLICLLAIPIVFSALITLVPDKQLPRRQRIGWRVVVIVTGTLYSGILLLVIAKGK